MKMKVKVKKKLNEEIQKLRVLGFLSSDIVVNRTYLSIKEGFSDSSMYDLGILLENLRKNEFTHLYVCINKLLEEEHINRAELYKKLSKYKFGNNINNPNMGGSIMPNYEGKNEYSLSVDLDDNGEFISLAMHEFNHFASFKIDGTKVSCGFQKSKLVFVKSKNKKLELEERYISGLGINEGFTEVLTSNQVFNGKACMAQGELVVAVGYPICYQYMKCLADIIGIDQMKKWYYEGDCDALFDEISKYSNTDATQQFYEWLDLFADVDFNRTDISNLKLNKIARQCSKFLSTLSINKYGKDITENNNVSYINRKKIPNQIEQQFEKLGVIKIKR